MHLQEEETLHLPKGFPVMVKAIIHIMWFGKERRGWVSHNKGFIFHTVAGAGNSHSLGGGGWNCMDCVVTDLGRCFEPHWPQEWCCSSPGLPSTTPPVSDGKGLYLKSYWMFPHFRCRGTDTRIFSLHIGACQIKFIATERFLIQKLLLVSENCLDKKLPTRSPFLE